MAYSPAPSYQYKEFKTRNPKYRRASWAVHRALYEGGERLYEDDEVMREVFPQHESEDDGVYCERKKRAPYIPYAGEIIDHLVSGLMAAPVTMKSEDAEARSEYWTELHKDVSPPNGREVSLQELLRHQVVTALLCGRAWTAVERPKAPEGVASRADEQAAGALDAYMCWYEPEQVIDWEEDETGELERLLTCTKSRPWGGLGKARKNIRLEFLSYEREGWAKYAIEYDPDQKSEPHDDDIVELVGHGEIGLGRVPFVPLEVPAGLYAMAKLRALATAHFNLLAALLWGLYKCGYSQLYEFLGPEVSFEKGGTADAQQDPSRATRSPRSIAHVQVRGAEDRAEFVGPDTGGFTTMLQVIQALRDEQHRVMFAIALAIDNTGSVLRSSGESKRENRVATAVIQRALGQLVREHARRCYEMAAALREEEIEWVAEGADSFDESDLEADINKLLMMGQAGMRSPHYWIEAFFAAAKKDLGDTVDESVLKEIRKDLEQLYTLDQAMDPMGLMAGDDGDGEGGGADGDDEGDDDEEPRPRKANGGAAQGAPARRVSTFGA